MLIRFARFRVPLGFVSTAVALGLATPSWRSWSAGLTVAVVGALLRLWAAGHIDKGREITSSGPYRLVRHPLYLGSGLLGLGFVVAANNVLTAVLVGSYLGAMLTLAVRAEEAALDEKFHGAYSEYRAGRMAGGNRRFSWSRVAANREYRAVLGLAGAFLVLVFRIGR